MFVSVRIRICRTVLVDPVDLNCDYVFSSIMGLPEIRFRGGRAG